MTTLTAPVPQANILANNGEKPINLFQLGCLFVIRSSYWSRRIGNEPQDFHLSPHEVESKAIASFGSKELVDPHKGRKLPMAVACFSADREESPPPACDLLEAVPCGERLLRTAGACAGADRRLRDLLDKRKASGPRVSSWAAEWMLITMSHCPATAGRRCEGVSS